MKSRITSLLMLLVLAVCLAFLGMRFYQWWQDHQKRKELFVYLQKKSEVTRHLPSDAVAYLNLYQFKKVYDGLDGTKFYDVLAHWFDTGMSDKQKGNPLLGGMLEKTILDVLGEEFGVALLPASSGRMDYVAVARVAPGSQFILKLALASAKNTRTISFNEETIYAFLTKDATYPEIFVYLDDDFAFSSSSLERLKQASSTPGNGPSFLAQLEVEAVPQDNFLFFETKQPQLSLRGYGESGSYHLRVSGESKISSHLPEYKENGQTVLRLQTNGAEIWNQPAATYLIESMEGTPSSHLLLTFADPKKAAGYGTFILNDYSRMNSLPSEIINKKGFECYHYNRNEDDEYVCRGDTAVMLARGRLDLENFGFDGKKISGHQQPLVLDMSLHRDRIQDYLQKVIDKDWSHFGDAKEFYFLSCIKKVSGAIDGSNNEVYVELE